MRLLEDYGALPSLGLSNLFSSFSLSNLFFEGTVSRVFDVRFFHVFLIFDLLIFVIFEFVAIQVFQYLISPNDKIFSGTVPLSVIQTSFVQYR
jgi:hypothetical protein